MRKDNDKNKEKKDDNVIEFPHMTKDELEKFNKLDKEMEARNLHFQNANLKITNQQLKAELELNKLIAERNIHNERLEEYRKIYETFLNNIANKYKISTYKKMGIDPESGLLKDLS